MKIITLIKKELRESLPFILAAGLLMLTLGSLFLKVITGLRYRNYYSCYDSMTSIVSYGIQTTSALSEVGPWLLVLSIALGLAIGIRQFWVAFYSRTWGFEICRPITRASILASKIIAAIIGFVLSVGLVWSLLFWYISQPGIWYAPPVVRIYIEGWIFIALGFVVYLSVALAGLSSANWFTTKLFSLVFALYILIACTCDWRLPLIFLFIAVSILILLSQITENFLKRQF
jgi:ABC-type transport system involved in multi-copper enzyme maturation permease subunit